ncbi:hypothetical protein IJ384_05385 [bacterium]|nr:hypothetical protein [bacterium]
MVNIGKPQIMNLKLVTPGFVDGPPPPSSPVVSGAASTTPSFDFNAVGNFVSNGDIEGLKKYLNEHNIPYTETKGPDGGIEISYKYNNGNYSVYFTPETQETEKVWIVPDNSPAKITFSQDELSKLGFKE